MPELKYLIGYPDNITDQARQLIDNGQLGKR